jgi:hypothetical protein
MFSALVLLRQGHASQPVAGRPGDGPLDEWVKTVRRPVVLTFSFVQPVLWILFFGFPFSSLTSG